MTSKSKKNNGLAVSAGIASALVALILVLLKLWAFGVTSALSVATSLADSALDLMISLGGLAAILYAQRPPDEDHAFGHDSAQDMAAFAQSLLIGLSAVAIAVSAIRRLYSGQENPLMAETGGMAIMGVSICLTLALVTWQRYVYRRTGNAVVNADSWHYLSDLMPNIAAITALWASSRFDLGIIDTLVALLGAGILLFAALKIGRRAMGALMDEQVDQALIDSLSRIARDFPGVHGFHDLKTRRSGAKVFVNLHVELDGTQSLSDAHAIGAGLRRKILKAHPECDVIIHKDPVGERPHPDDPSKN